MTALKRSAACLACSLLLAGCAQKAEVAGRVTYEGNPVSKGGLVVVFDADGGNSIDRGDILPDGTYSITGIVPGKKTLIAAANRPYVPPMKGLDIPQSDLEFPDGAEGNNVQLQLKPGKNQLDLNLRKPPQSKME